MTNVRCLELAGFAIVRVPFTKVAFASLKWHMLIGRVTSMNVDKF
jgi:hypothetical protein